MHRYVGTGRHPRHTPRVPALPLFRHAARASGLIRIHVSPGSPLGLQSYRPAARAFPDSKPAQRGETSVATRRQPVDHNAERRCRSPRSAATQNGVTETVAPYHTSSTTPYPPPSPDGVLQQPFQLAMATYRVSHLCKRSPTKQLHQLPTPELFCNNPSYVAKLKAVAKPATPPQKDIQPANSRLDLPSHRHIPLYMPPRRKRGGGPEISPAGNTTQPC